MADLKKFNNVDASKLIEADFNNKSYARLVIQMHGTDNCMTFEHVIVMANIEMNGHMRIRIYDTRYVSDEGACVTFTTWANKEIRVPRISASVVTLVRY